jgi:hypothetical protein
MNIIVKEGKLKPQKNVSKNSSKWEIIVQKGQVNIM